MSLSSGRVCELKNTFRRCRNEASGLCQYCGRAFCNKHGTRYHDGQEVCHRKICQKKMVELPHHLAYKARAEQLNRQSRCGLPGCTAPQWGQCSACGYFFCRGHIHPRTQTVRIGMVVESRPVSMCYHCWDRWQRIWSRL